MLVCTGSTALFLWRNQLNSLANGLAERATSPAPKAPLAAGLKPVQPIPTNFTWSLNVTNAPLPNTEVAGSIHGNGFLCERATLRAGRFSLRQGQTGPPDLGITVLLGVRQPEELSGKTVVIAPGTPAPVPRVVLHWKDDQQDPVTERIQSGYAMKLLFGPAFNGRMRGRIFIALPDEEKSFAAGIFDAEIIKLAQPLANK